MGLLGGSDTRINATFTATDRVTPVIRGMRGEVSRLGSRTGGPLGGLLAGIGGLNVGMVGLGFGVVGAVGALGSFAKAAIDDQASVDHLTTALKANVPAWTGNTSAIDAFIKKGQDLAFTDDDIRESMSQLVTRTHDVGAAMKLTREAMDLARLKGISLSDAAEILGKVFSGQVSSARRAGIAIDANATSTEALAQIQKAAAGQAETYGKSQAGTLAKISDQWSEMQESIGTGVMGLIDGLGKVGTAFDNIHRAVDPNYKLTQDTEQALKDQAKALGLNGDAVVEWIAQQKAAADQQQANLTLTHKQEMQNEVLAAQQANQAVNIVELSNKYSAYGVTVGDVTTAVSDAANGTLTLQTATDQNAEATAKARQQIAAYAIATGTASVLALANASAMNQQSAAARQLAADMAVLLRLPAFYGGPGGSSSPAPSSSGPGGESGRHVPNGGSLGDQHIHLNLDGKEVAHVVNQWMGRQQHIAGRSHSRN